MALVEIALLGTPIVRVDGDIVTVERRKSLAIIAYLAATGQQHRRDELSSIFWADVDQSRALANLRQALVDMRRVLPEDTIIANRSSMGLDLSTDIWVDTQQFDLVQAQFRQTNDYAALFGAIQLYLGDFMTGFSLNDTPEFDDWQRIEAERYRRETIEALDKLARHYWDIGDIEYALDFANRLLEINRLDETVHRLLMRLYVANKQHTEAMNQYWEVVKLLDEELGLDPQPATKKLYEDILNLEVHPEDTDPLIQVKLPQSLYPPQPNLIIGRKDALNDLHMRLGIDHSGSHPMTIIQGSLGVGKSTIVNHLAHDPKVKVAYPDGLLWVSLGRNPQLRSHLLDWASVFGLSVDEASTAELTAHIRGIVQARRMLLIIDDVWQASDALAFNVAGQRCATMITTRFASVARQLAPSPADIYRLAPLSQVDGQHLLELITPSTAERYREQLTDLVGAYDGIPLALQVMGRMLEDEMAMGWGVTDMLDDLLNTDAILNGIAPPDVSLRLRQSQMTLRDVLKQGLEYVPIGLLLTLKKIADDPDTRDEFSVEQAGIIWDNSDPKTLLRQFIELGAIDVLGDGRFHIPTLYAAYLRDLER